MFFLILASQFCVLAPELDWFRQAFVFQNVTDDILF